MLFKRKQRKPGPTGTGEFIDNIHWWFWDDAITPGLLSRDAFAEVRSAALTKDDAARLSTALIAGSIIPHGKKDVQNKDLKSLLLKRVSDYLSHTREKSPEIFTRWIEEKWTRGNTRESMLDVFKAYLNIIEFWGYPFGWQKIKDARDLEAGIVLQAGGVPRYFISDDDIREIRGYPFCFTVWIDGIRKAESRSGGGNWHFHYQDGAFDMRFVQHSND